jgi:hypothetical protein
VTASTGVERCIDFRNGCDRKNSPLLGSLPPSQNASSPDIPAEVHHVEKPTVGQFDPPHAGPRCIRDEPRQQCLAVTAKELIAVSAKNTRLYANNKSNVILWIYPFGMTDTLIVTTGPLCRRITSLDHHDAGG